MNHKFYKLLLVNYLISESSRLRQEVTDELINQATDNNIVQRRLKMLVDISAAEIQLLEKISNFKTDQTEDYIHGRALMLQDLNWAVSRNA